MDIIRFLEIEKKYNLLESEIDGVNLWEIARNNIWHVNICAKSLDMGTAHRTHRFDSIKHKSIYYFFHGMKLPKTDNRPVLFINHPRRIKVGNFYDCIYTEDLSDRFESVVMEGTGDGFHYVPVRTQNLVCYDSVLYFAQRYLDRNKERNSIKYRLTRRHIIEKLGKPLSEIMDAYSIEMNSDEVYDFLTQEYFKYKYIRRQVGIILDRIKPAFIVEVCYYCHFCMAMNEMARKRGITTVELQHGVMDNENLAYQYGTDQLVKQLPEYIYVFSDYWKKVATVPDRSTKMIVTGFPYFESQLEKYKSHKRNDLNQRTVLFVSQGTIGKELSKLAVNVADLLAHEEYRFIYKLHPGEYEGWRDYYPWLSECGSIEVVDNNDNGIYDYFSISDIQIGVYSMALYEGIGFGLITYIYNIGRADTMRDLSDLGYAKMFDTVEELIELIRHGEKYVIEKKEFWKKDALNNIIKELTILSEHTGVAQKQ